MKAVVGRPHHKGGIEAGRGERERENRYLWESPLLHRARNLGFAVLGLRLLAYVAASFGPLARGGRQWRQRHRSRSGSSTYEGWQKNCTINPRA